MQAHCLLPRWIAPAFALVLSACGPERAPDAPSGNLAPDAVQDRAAEIRAATATVHGMRIGAADAEPGNWLAHGRTYAEERHSPLADINADTVGDLGLAWYWNTGDVRGLEATPIVVDGVLFTTGTWSRVYANDGRTGELIWQYDPEVPRQWAKYACCDVVNRGVAVWKGRVFVGTLDGRLVALDAGNGDVIWEVLTIDPERPYTITGAPRVVNDMVVIGNGGAEYGVRGYVTAYDWETGAQKWRFHTVPGDPSKPHESPAMEMAAATWHGGNWWEVGGGGTVWDSMAFDPELDLLYIGVGNGSPWNREIRSPGGGDNLFLASIVALDPDDGSLVWHYQTTPGETWDYTATQHMILADLEIGGDVRKVIMQAPKNGFFYVLDRTDGTFISAEPYVAVNWAQGIDPETGRPIENPGARYVDDTAVVFPSAHGGHNWHPMAYSPDTRLVYVPVLDMGFPYAQHGDFVYQPGEMNPGIDIGALLPPKTPAERVAMLQSMKGHLAAWDPVNQREAWRVQHATTWNGGVLSTAGNLVFQGRSDGVFAAYAADTARPNGKCPCTPGSSRRLSAMPSTANSTLRSSPTGAGRSRSSQAFRDTAATSSRRAASSPSNWAAKPSCQNPRSPTSTFPSRPPSRPPPRRSNGRIALPHLVHPLSRRRRDLGQFRAGSQVPAIGVPLALGPHRAPRRLRHGRHAGLRPCVERVGFECDPRLRRERGEGGDRVLPVGVPRTLPRAFRHGVYEGHRR